MVLKIPLSAFSTIYSYLLLYGICLAFFSLCSARVFENSTSPCGVARKYKNLFQQDIRAASIEEFPAFAIGPGVSPVFLYVL